MTKVQELLRQVVLQLKQEGIVESREMIESIAALLTEGQASYRPELAAEKPRYAYGGSDAAIKEKLLEASRENEVGGPARLFDRYVLFLSSKRKEAWVYPIPRHIVDFMLSLLQIGPQDSMADFTCCSGGFLVNRDEVASNSTGHIYGIEILPGWARIAAANALLHGIKQESIHLYIGDAFHICSATGPLADKTFERIALAPPFGLSIDDTVIAEAFREEKANGEHLEHSSQALFVRLALKKLAQNGRAVIMVPPGLLYRKDTLKLRQKLVNDYFLEAVITLNDYLLSPFTNEAVNILLIRQKEPEPQEQTWFFRIQHDGYPLRPGRDLMDAPSSPSDLPLVQAATFLSEKDFTVNATDTLFTRSVMSGIDFLGIAVKMRDDATVLEIRHYRKEAENYLLITVAAAGKEPGYYSIRLSKDHALSFYHTENQKKDWLTTLYKTQERNLPSGALLLNQSITGQIFIITPDGRLQGVTQTVQQLQEAAYDLRPESYARHFGDQVTRPPAVLLDEVRTDQHIALRYVDYLLGQLELKTLVGKPLPPVLEPLDDLSFPGFFSKEQGRIWDNIKKQVDETGRYALHFIPDDVLLDNSPENWEKTVQALDLFERMGLIVRVTMQHSATENVATYYRLKTQLDTTRL